MADNEALEESSSDSDNEMDIEVIDLREQEGEGVENEEEEEQRQNRVFDVIRRMAGLRRHLNRIQADYRRLIDDEEEMDQNENRGARQPFDTRARMSNNYLFNELYTETRLCDELEENSIHELLYIIMPHIVYPGFSTPFITEEGRLMRVLEHSISQSGNPYVVLLPYVHYTDFDVHHSDFEVPPCDMTFDEDNQPFATVAKVQKFRLEPESLKLEFDVKYRCIVQGLVHGSSSGCKAKVMICPEISLLPIEKAVCGGSSAKLSPNKQKRICCELVNYPECAIKCNTEENCNKLANLTYVFVNQEDIQKHLKLGVSHFSYWLGSNLPIESRTQYELLKEDVADWRIFRLLSIVKNLASVVCVHCGSELCQLSHLINMNPEGTSGHFVNSHGYVHDMITVSEATSYSLQGNPTAEYSWFDGYKWTIMNCRGCHHHIGWRFTSKTFVPERFFGLTRTSFRPQIATEEQE
ncbi:hypothetical protein WR25_16156 [Diploscapter pachys]|uniref:CULT domain-containing protein n=1 Tax=Diploscapter pachys TaxID=2018661 RepID=A0A2A2JNY3_9BILA|nr:hypothetical protein WR25_16156 [Diploscapter pachys]